MHKKKPDGQEKLEQQFNQEPVDLDVDDLERVLGGTKGLYTSPAAAPVMQENLVGAAAAIGIGIGWIWLWLGVSPWTTEAPSPA